MVISNFKNFFKNFLYFFINFSMIAAGIVLACAFFLVINTHILKLQNAEFIEVMKNYFINTVNKVDFIDIFDLKVFSKVFKDMIYIGESYGVNVNLYFFLTGAVSIAIVFFTYKGSIALIDHIHKIKFNNKYTKHGFWSHVIKIAIGLLTSILTAITIYVTRGSPIVIVIIYFILDAIETLFLTYYVYFTGIKFNKFITSKNAFLVLLLFFFSQSIFVGIAMLLWTYIPIVALIIVLPLLAYSTTNVRYTVIEYFKKNIKRDEKNAKVY